MYRENGLDCRRPGQGRHRSTTPRQDRYLQQVARRHRHATARELRNEFGVTYVTISDQTIRNRLHEAGLRSRIPARTPQLTPQHRAARLEFAREHQTWQLRHWRPVLFTDESRFHISTCDRRVPVWRQHAWGNAMLSVTLWNMTLSVEAP